MMIRVLVDDRYRRLAWLLFALVVILLTGCDTQDGGGGGY